MKKDVLKIKALAESGILIGLSTALSFITIVQMPLGGSVTLASMLPICIIGIKHGKRYGFISAFLYALIQLLIGFVKDGLLAWGLNGIQLTECIIFDYILAYASLGFSSLFRNKGTKGILFSILIAFSLRFFFHVLSGVVVFRFLDQWDLFNKTFSGKPILYSVCYNGLYILPELIITYIVLIIMIKIPYIKKSFIDKK